MADVTVLTLVKYHQWYIPATTADYKLTRTLGMCSTQLHEDTLGVIRLMCEKRGIELRGRKFQSVMSAFQESIEAFWEKKHRQVVMNKSRWVFRANKTAYAKAKKKSVELLERKLRAFFERWGIDSEFTFTENEGSSLKLVVDFKKRQRLPVIPVKDIPEDTSKALTVGNHRIVTSQDRRFFYFEIQTKCGSEWKRILFSRARHEDISDPMDFVGSLIDSYSK